MLWHPDAFICHSTTVVPRSITADTAGCFFFVALLSGIFSHPLGLRQKQARAARPPAEECRGEALMFFAGAPGGFGMETVGMVD